MSSKKKVMPFSCRLVFAILSNYDGGYNGGEKCAAVIISSPSNGILFCGDADVTRSVVYILQTSSCHVIADGKGKGLRKNNY